mmetsp:Transcript_103739/g.231638  ORF Transcript_103739/g.231638 Transcript_103739/m.231638 type:complete len:285 (+) Transcript_103739:625-1479(+)
MLRLRYVQLLGKVFEELLCADLGIIDMPEARDDRGRSNNLEVVPTLLVVDAHGVASAAHLDHLQHAPIPQLLRHGLPVVTVGLIIRIRLDAADEMRLRQVHNIHQACKLVFELQGYCVLFLLLPITIVFAESLGVLGVVSKELPEESVRTASHARDKVMAELVLVFVEEAIGAVADWPREVLDNKPRGLRLDLVESAVAPVLLHDLVAEALVRTLRHQAFLVEDGEHTCVLGLQDVHRILVVREIQTIPGDALPLVQLLLEFEDKGIEEILQALVGEVDAHLLE